MKIVTWNINGYRAVTGQNASKRFDKITKENKLFKYIDEEQPDIITLQEIKAEPSQIIEELRCPEGYYANYNYSKSKKGYSGVATFSKIQAKTVNSNIGIEEFDIEGRILESEFENLVHFGVYFPKGYTDNERLDYKMNFYTALYDYIKNKYTKDTNIVISGDFNTAHHEIDLARPKDNTNTSGFLQIEREKLDELIQMGYSDSFRILNKEPNHYSWWSQRGRARENNVGWRIDYHFVSNSLLPLLKNSVIQSDVFGSDHCPVLLELELD